MSEGRAAAEALDAELSELAEASAPEPAPRAGPATASGSRGAKDTWGGWLRSKLAVPSHDAAKDGGRFAATVRQSASLKPKDPQQQQQQQQAASMIQAVQRGKSTRTALRHAPPAADDVPNPFAAPPALVTRGNSPSVEVSGSGWRRPRIFSMLQPARPATTVATSAVATTGRVSPLTDRLSPGVGSSSARGQKKEEPSDMEAVLKAQREKAKADADARRAQLLAGGPGGAVGSSGGAASSAVAGAAGACGEAMNALRERGEKLENLHAGMAKMSDEAESLFETARKIREKNERNAKWLPF